MTRTYSVGGGYPLNFKDCLIDSYSCCRFYQYLPDACEWDFGIIWGHAYSENLVHWEHLPPALVPSPDWVDADGCFSGCCVQHHDTGKPMILYTGVRLRSNHDAGNLPPPEQDLGMVWIESQCAAVPADDDDDLLIRWNKLEMPFLNLPPKGYELTGWRDPFIFASTSKEDMRYKMLIGSGIKDKGGTALVYGSQHLDKEWKLLGMLCEGIADDTGVVWECPLIVPLAKMSHELSLRKSRRAAPLWLFRQSDMPDSAKEKLNAAQRLSSADLVLDTHGAADFARPKHVFSKEGQTIQKSFSGFNLPERDSVDIKIVNTQRIVKKNPGISLLAKKLEQVVIEDSSERDFSVSSSDEPSIASRVNSAKPNQIENEETDKFEALKSKVKPVHTGKQVGDAMSGLESTGMHASTSKDHSPNGWHFFTVSPDAPTNPVLYWTGHMLEEDSENCPKFDIDNAKGPFRLDLGDILYAPNVCQDGHGRWLLWGWLQERRKVGSYAYSGCLTAPRILHVTDEGRLIQAPVPEIEKLREMERSFKARRIALHPNSVFPLKSVKSERLDIQCSIERGSAAAAGLLFRSHEAEAEGSTAIIYDWNNNQFEAIFNVPHNWKPAHIADSNIPMRQNRSSEDSHAPCDPAVMLCTPRSMSNTESFTVCVLNIAICAFYIKNHHVCILQKFYERERNSAFTTPESPLSPSIENQKEYEVASPQDNEGVAIARSGSSISIAMRKNSSMSNFGSFVQQSNFPRSQSMARNQSLPRSSFVPGSQLNSYKSFMQSTPSMLNLAQQDDTEIEDEDLGNLLEDLAAPMRHEDDTSCAQQQEPRRVGGSLSMQADDVLHLRIFVDHSCVEVFTGTGEVLSTRIYRGRGPDPDNPGIDFVSFGGQAVIDNVEAYEMRSCWRNKAPTPVDRRRSLEAMRSSLRKSIDKDHLSVDTALSIVRKESKLFDHTHDSFCVDCDVLSPQSGIAF